MKKPIHKIWWYWIIVILLWAFICSRFPKNDQTALIYLLGFPIIIVFTLLIGRNQKKKNQVQKIDVKQVEENPKQEIVTKKQDLNIQKPYVFRHIYGISHISKNALADVFITKEKIIIECERRKFELLLDSLTAAEGLRKTDLLKKQKTVIGRGIVGGLVLGPLGAVIGGISGVGEKNKKGNYLILNYKSTADDEVKVIIFNVKNIQEAQRIAKLLTERIVSKKSNDGIIQL